MMDILLPTVKTIHSLDLQIGGGITDASQGDFSAVAQSMEITGPTFFPFFIYANSIYASGSINLYANTVQLNQAALSAGNQINFYVTNSLSDNGTANTFICNNGFNLRIKPQTGDLLGSTLTSVASGNNAVVNSSWAGQDRGASWAGFTNNEAVGTLVLSATNYLPQYTPLFIFSGTTGSNAMYVTTLDLSQVTTSSANLAGMIQINPGMKIYVSQVILGFTPPGGQSPSGFRAVTVPGSDHCLAQYGSRPEWFSGREHDVPNDRWLWRLLGI